MSTILLTGGGTAGHVSSNLALIPHLKEMGFEVVYVGSYDGIEKQLIPEAGVPYYGIASGKLRRYFSLKNFTDIFRVIHGYFQSRKLMKQLKPDLVFSKGGFVSVPVVMAAGHKKIPCIIHECDMTPGLANKLAIPYATRICTNFAETAAQFPEGKAVHTGTPIRESLFQGDAARGRAFCGFSGQKPVLMVTGGSLGAGAVNDAVRGALDALTKEFQIVHLCGKGKRDEALDQHPGYVQIEYANEEMKDLYALADLVISRAGANTIAEILALGIPNILIPLPLSQSRGDQILNAEAYEKRGYSYVLPQEKLNQGTLIQAVHEVMEHKDQYIQAMQAAPDKDGVGRVLDVIREEAGK